MGDDSIHGTGGAIRWDFERMSEFELYRADDPQDRGLKTVDHPAESLRKIEATPADCII